jgi:hypothetical protein
VNKELIPTFQQAYERPIDYRGSIWKIVDNSYGTTDIGYYILAQTRPDEYRLISLKDGNRWDDYWQKPGYFKANDTEIIYVCNGVNIQEEMVNVPTYKYTIKLGGS